MTAQKEVVEKLQKAENDRLWANLLGERTFNTLYGQKQVVLPVKQRKPKKEAKQLQLSYDTLSMFRTMYKKQKKEETPISSTPKESAVEFRDET